ncbi:MAG: hypothetical protein OEZ68_15725 [Gammaproteobacteria bacterium]|nr:hypothetical protein [Gammaproteobacteria bacterium]MDH5802250.1 hypothetical protein [Gammaproteobacteria bacterium]
MHHNLLFTAHSGKLGSTPGCRQMARNSRNEYTDETLYQALCIAHFARYATSLQPPQVQRC